MTDVKTLIFRAQAGDEQAFADLMRAHYAFVYTIVMGIVGNPQDAEEIVQDVFVNTYRGLAQYEERTKFRSWLAKIARNRALNWTRDQRSENVSINDVHERKLQTPDALADQLIRAEHRELIRDALEALSPKDRKIARSYFLDGASYEELIRTHKLSYKAISVRLSRAKRKLSKRLRHLLTGVFVSPTTTLKQICTGGLTVMKVGTVSKIIVGSAAIIGLGVVGTHHFISSKEDSSPSVEIITSTSVPRTDSTRKKAVHAPRIANEPQISAEEMEQIEGFFAQLETADAQDPNVEIAEADSPHESVNSGSSETPEAKVVSEPQEKRVFGLTRSEIEAKTAELRKKIHQALEERLDLLDLVETLSEFSSEDEEIYLLARQTYEKTRELRKTIFTLRREYSYYSDGDISPFQPGGEFHDLFAQNHIGVKRITE